MTDDASDSIDAIASADETPLSADDLAFEAPWQLRSFGAVVALYEDGLFPWEEIQDRLIDEVQDGETARVGDTPNEVFYEQWLVAVERLLVDEGIVDPGELDERAREFAAGERDASEFVAGEAHTHDH